MRYTFDPEWIGVAVFAFASLAGVTYNLFSKLKTGMVWVVATVAFVGLGAASYGVSSLTYNAPPMTASELVVTWTGISPGTEYSIATADHPVDDNHGVFSALERDTSHGRDVLKAIFTKDGEGVPLELLMDDIDLLVTPGNAIPSIALFMDDSQTYGTKEKVGDGPCRIVVRGVWFFCERALAYRPAVSDRASDIGLSAVFRESLDHAVITVPPELRDTIFHQGKSG